MRLDNSIIWHKMMPIGCLPPVLPPPTLNSEGKEEEGEEKEEGRGRKKEGEGGRRKEAYRETTLTYGEKKSAYGQRI